MKNNNKESNFEPQCGKESCQSCSSASLINGVLVTEENIRERIDEGGVKWFKAYFGGGAHYRNWLAQTQEIFGNENIVVEEVKLPGLKCFQESDEKAFRVWVREDHSKR